MTVLLKPCTATCLGLLTLFVAPACGDSGGDDDATGTGGLPTMPTTPSSASESSAPGGTTADSNPPTTSSAGTESNGETNTVLTMDESSTSEGTKFDLGSGETTDTDPTGTSVGGSCRPSEIYGAAGGFPAYTDPAYAPFLDRSVIVMTSNSYQDSDYVLHIFDISPPVPPPNMNYAAPRYRHPSWTQANIGKVFGLTLDSFGNIYVAASTVYGPTQNPSKIKKIDHITGEVSDFATLPNNGPAFGNINYDCISQTIYVANHEDGRIYQVNMAGQIVSTYRHLTKEVTMGAPADAPDGQYSPLGDRVWAIQSHAGRLYYSVWNEDGGRNGPDNEIWSVGYTDSQGIPDGAQAELEFKMPGYLGGDWSNPVSDLSFAATGWMLVSQRSMYGDNQTGAHQSTTYEYQYNAGTWELKGTTFIIGDLPGSATGGVDHDFAENGYVWMTGDALDFNSPNVVYGLQGTPHEGGGVEVSTLIDYDGDIVNQSKTLEGDCEVPIPGDAMPVPPPG